MKNLLTLVILLFPTLYGWADEENTVKKTTDAHITGHIILKETGEHLPFRPRWGKGPPRGPATAAPRRGGCCCGRPPTTMSTRPAR